jgi:hypothetical protein
MLTHIEICPRCGETSAVGPKLVLIDAAPGPEMDARTVYHSNLRADDVKAENRREPPLEQFLDGFYCDRCNRGFVSEEGLKEDRRQYCCH